MEEYKISLREIQQMIFVSNALNDGWTVKKVGNDKYEFIKPSSSEITHCSSLEEFVQHHMDVRRIISPTSTSR
jgi:hypothetical protein